MAKRPGKYAGVISKLPKLQPEYDDPSYADVVTALKEKIINEDPVKANDPNALAREYRRLRQQKDEAEKLLSEINVHLEAYGTLLIDAYDAADTTSITLASGGSVSVQPEPYAKIVDREAFRQWCLRNGFERSMTLPWQTANAETKERLLKGEPEPDGIQAQVRTKIVVRS